VFHASAFYFTTTAEFDDVSSLLRACQGDGGGFACQLVSASLTSSHKPYGKNGDQHYT
jgi:hypothetical protein